MEKLDKVIYRGSATSTGGRAGKVISSDKALDLQLTRPVEMGGRPDSGGTNPEQLFAAGYSACFLSAMAFVANRDKLTMPSDAQVTCEVGIGLIPQGFGLEVDMKVSLPGLSAEDARILMDRAHIVCPYSNATRGNIDVVITLK